MRQFLSESLPFLAMGAMMTSFAAEQDGRMPNVILILTDDQGSIDLNCYGSDDLKTPHMDRLAKEGTRFTQFYAGSSISSPSRAGLLTGKSPQRAGVPGNVSSMEGVAGMSAGQVTLADLLKQAGYATGHVGKWHLGYTPETMPLGQGFDYSFGHMGGCIDNYSHFFYWQGPNRHDLWENMNRYYRDGEYFPDLMVEKATSFIKENKSNPFFLYLAYNTPHYPLQPTAKWREYYKDLPSPRREYAGFISSTDESIGEILDFLEKEDLRDNTLIIFLSDHGHSYEERTMGGGGNAGPYRSGKFSLFEGGIRVPAIFSWMGRIPEGATADHIGLSMDIFPSIADFCGIGAIPPEIEGRSLLPLIMEGKDVYGEDVMYWQLHDQWVVRKGEWKLIGNPRDPSAGDALSIPGDRLFLSNLVTDVSESKNLAEMYPEKVDELIREYLKWDFSDKANLP
jgi:arylsulfatase A